MKIEKLDIGDLESDKTSASNLPLVFNSLQKNNFYKQKNVAPNKVFRTNHYNLYPLYKPICICMNPVVKIKVESLY